MQHFHIITRIMIRRLSQVSQQALVLPRVLAVGGDWADRLLSWEGTSCSQSGHFAQAGQQLIQIRDLQVSSPSAHGGTVDPDAET